MTVLLKKVGTFKLPAIPEGFYRRECFCLQNPFVNFNYIGPRVLEFLSGEYIATSEPELVMHKYELLGNGTTQDALGELSLPEENVQVSEARIYQLLAKQPECQIGRLRLSFWNILLGVNQEGVTKAVPLLGLPDSGWTVSLTFRKNDEQDGRGLWHKGDHLIIPQVW